MIQPSRPNRAPVICLLGGESSGKTTLSLALHRVLTQDHGLTVALVPEHLRAWCGIQQRAPYAHEQAGIAHEQTRLISQTQAAAGIQLVIADTSALSVAAYSALYFADHSVFTEALTEQSAYDITLLMGLDLTWRPDGLLRDGPEHRANADALLRRELQSRGIPFQTIYGTGKQRLRNALRALTPMLTPLLGHAPVATDALRTQGRPGWACEACSDPACEHRLFSRLMKLLPTSRDTP